MKNSPNDYLCALDDFDLELLELLKSHIAKRKQIKKKAALSLEEYAEDYFANREEEGYDDYDDYEDYDDYPESETPATEKVGAVFLPMPVERISRPVLKRFLARIR